MAAAAVGIQGERLEETLPRVQGLDILPAEAREALQSLHSRERRGVDGVGSLPAPISTAEFLKMPGRVQSPGAAPSSRDWEVIRGWMLLRVFAEGRRFRLVLARPLISLLWVCLLRP